MSRRCGRGKIGTCSKAATVLDMFPSLRLDVRMDPIRNASGYRDALPDPLRPAVLRLDKRQTADAIQQALEMRRSGLARDAMEATVNGLVAELLADALLSAGYIVAVPQAGRETDKPTGPD